MSTSDLIAGLTSLNKTKLQIEMDHVKMIISGVGGESRAHQIGLWPEYSSSSLNDNDYDDVSVFDDTANDLLTRMSRNVSEVIQFPVNSVFIHGLAVLSSAMNKGFSYKYHGTGPVTIYSVVSQPPSTGKSGVHGAFFHPIRIAFEGYNKIQEKKRASIEYKISKIKKEMKNAEEYEIEAIAKSIEDLESQLEETHVYNYSVSDSTPESLARGALGHGGLFNVLSDESAAISSVLGEMYGSGGKTNSECILKGWDGEYVSISRVGSGDIKGFVRGSVAVLAQDGVIESILKIASEGNGIAERFFLLKEANMFGKRKRRRKDRIHKDESLHSEYANLVAKLVHTDDFIFNINNDSIDLIEDACEAFEPELSDGGRYSKGMLRGVAGKFDKRVVKVACILHVAKNWDTTGGPDTVDTQCVERAIHICKEMMRAYEKTAQSEGYVGSESECMAIIDALTRYTSRGKLVTNSSQLRDTVKRLTIFKDTPKLAAYIAHNITPKLESLGYCCVIKKKIYINPHLRGA
jgi:hypothetical protein